MKYKGRPTSNNIEDRRTPAKMRNQTVEHVGQASTTSKAIAKFRDYSHLVGYIRPKKSKKETDKRG